MTRQKQRNNSRMGRPVINADRDNRIYQLRRSGWRHSDIAEEFGLSITRAADIFYKECKRRKESPVVRKKEKK